MYLTTAYYSYTYGEAEGVQIDERKLKGTHENLYYRTLIMALIHLAKNVTKVKFKKNDYLSSII
jgi:cytochrome b